MLRQAQARHRNSGLNAQQWDEFLLIYKGDVDKSLTGLHRMGGRQRSPSSTAFRRRPAIRTSR